MEHYIFHKEYITKTRAEVISDTVEFFPKQFNMPLMYYTDTNIHNAHDLMYALQNPEPASPLVKLGNIHKKV